MENTVKYDNIPTKGIKLFSIPVFELWLLLHFTKVNSYLTGEECIKRLKVEEPKYKKGQLTDKLKKVLTEKKQDAICRAKALEYPFNPSTKVYLLLEELEKINLR